jgi:prolyl oligopeptidase
MDPYRWLEDQGAPRTRAWLSEQNLYARSYLDAVPGRAAIRERIRKLLDVETCDSIHIAVNKYVFRKRTRGEEQPSIFLRDGPSGEDRLLLDPKMRGTGPNTAVRPLLISPDGRLLLYEVKEGGERTGTFEILDVRSRKTLPDVLPRGFLRGFVFASDGRGFYYVHEQAESRRPYYRAVFRHVFGMDFETDEQIFFAGEGEKIRLQMISGKHQLGFLVYRFLEKMFTDFYLWPLGSKDAPEPLVENAEYTIGPMLLQDGRILAITNRDAPNLRIVEIRSQQGRQPDFVDVVPACESRIQSWIATQNRIFVSYIREAATEIIIFDSYGKRLGRLPNEKCDTIRLAGGSADRDEVFFERESFTKPIAIYRYSCRNGNLQLWADRRIPFDSQRYGHTRVWFKAKDGTHIPMFLVGRQDVLECGSHPAIMTSYGGYGISMTPEFSVFVAFLLELGCLFALPCIRGGSEFGSKWHDAARRRNRQVAFDDFLCAAEWLIETHRTKPRKLAIFGGSNSGLLVGAAMTQRPDLFRAVVCLVPLLDMLRYHLFDNAGFWKDELGTSEDADDFAVLASYSPYHQVRDGTSYPATIIVSGDTDQNCNPLHARKMTARLQAANSSRYPILLDYRHSRGHSPVLPLSERIEALTDRMAFLCDQLELQVRKVDRP